MTKIRNIKNINELLEVKENQVIVLGDRHFLKIEEDKWYSNYGFDVVTITTEDIFKNVKNKSWLLDDIYILN